jgi:hypothetical protein
MLPETELFRVLTRHNVPFFVIGGHAVYYYGHRRLTEDADIVWLRSKESEIQLFTALTEIKAQYIGREIDPATGIEKMHEVSLPYILSRHLMMLSTSFGFLDLFDYIPGRLDLDVRAAFESSVVAGSVRFASLDLLFQMKKAAGRTKDLEDIEHLAKIHIPER